MYHTAVSLTSYSMRCFVSFMLHDDAILRRMFISHNINISTADRTHTREPDPRAMKGHVGHARAGPDTQRAQAHNHTQNSNPRTHPRQT